MIAIGFLFVFGRKLNRRMPQEFFTTAELALHYRGLGAEPPTSREQKSDDCPACTDNRVQYTGMKAHCGNMNKPSAAGHTFFGRCSWFFQSFLQFSARKNDDLSSIYRVRNGYNGLFKRSVRCEKLMLTL